MALPQALLDDIRAVDDAAPALPRALPRGAARAASNARRGDAAAATPAGPRVAQGLQRVGAHEALPPSARTPVPIGGPPRIAGSEHGALGREYGALSNLALCRFHMEGSDWNSVEQCFQALQFSDPAHREAIRQIPVDMGDFSRFASLVHGGTAWRMGELQGVARDPDFHALETMYLATVAKFEQSYAFRGALLRTATDSIEAAPNRGDWQRLHGLILERLREELKEPQHRDRSKLQSLCELFKAEGFNEERVAARHAAMVQKHAQLGRQHRLQAMMLDGRFVMLSAFGPDTVRSLRAELAQTIGVQIDRIDLILGGNRLRDEETVAALGVEDNTIMTVVIGRPIPRCARQRDADAHGDLLAAIRMRAVEAH